MQNPINPYGGDSFHTVASLFRHQSNLVTVHSDDSLRTAMRLMLDGRLSQIPVVDDGECRGVVSLRSITECVVSVGGEPLHIDKLSVKDALSTAPYISLGDTMDSLYERMERDEPVLVGTSQNLDAMVTPIVLLRRLREITETYILAQEIELALRQFIRLVVPEDKLDSFIRRTLTSKQDLEQMGDTVTFSLERLTFERLERIINNGDNYKSFQEYLGTPIVVRLRLKNIREIRNDIMHHRTSEISISQYTELVTARNFWLDRIRTIQRSKNVDSNIDAA